MVQELQKKLPEHSAEFINYQTTDSVLSVSKKLYDKINESCILIGHSLGGIIATLVGDHPKVQKIITLCTPFGGVRHAELMAMFSLEPLFYDLRQVGSVLIKARTKNISIPHLAIVGTNGLPFISETNDGAITLSSQMAREHKNTHYEILCLNHFEVLLSEQVAQLIKDFIE